jgi:histidinol-phosphate/aromatic aminotransferase/cobyric acid decarboxylase-like protein
MTMLRCERCHKEVVIMGVSLGAASDEDIGRIYEAMAREGQLVLFNPPPFEQHRCPACGSLLVDL